MHIIYPMSMQSLTDIPQNKLGAIVSPRSTNPIRGAMLSPLISYGNELGGPWSFTAGSEFKTSVSEIFNTYTNLTKVFVGYASRLH